LIYHGNSLETLGHPSNYQQLKSIIILKYPIAYLLQQKYATLRYYLEQISYSTFNSRPFELMGSPTFHRDFLLAVYDVCEYLGTDLSGFIEMTDDHSRWALELWDRVGGNADEFNRSIIGLVGRKNVCANTMCSFDLKYTYDTLYSILRMLSKRNGALRLCDYGCCNANISFSMLLGGYVSKLRMCDLYSESTEFIKRRIQKYGLEDRAEWIEVGTPATGELFDVVYCIDVLEHTLNPSQILEMEIAPLLEKQGYLIIQAPWGGGVVSHLDEAIVDFYTQGGRQYLSKNFKKIYSMTAMDISGVWKKNI
jgi:hypothetical protein